MARVSERKPCAKCPKGVGVTTCDGCQQSFCIKHIIEHRQELDSIMDNIGQEHDSLRRELGEKDTAHPLLLQINRWEEESIKKIQTTAETARASLQKLFNQKKNDLKTSVDKIAQELQAHREMEDYTEIDLTRWSTALTDIRKFSETPPSIEISENENISNVIRMISVLEKKPLPLLSSNITPPPDRSLPQPQKSYRSTEEIFNETTNSVALSESGLVATFTRISFFSQTIFGKNSYRSGIHHIHFRVENKDQNNFFFGIVTFSEAMVSDIYNASTANGWWGFDIAIINGKSQTRLGNKTLQPGDVVKLTLNCDEKQIQFENDRTKQILQSHVDIVKCPLPWKIAVSLARQNDILRILP